MKRCKRCGKWLDVYGGVAKSLLWRDYCVECCRAIDEEDKEEQGDQNERET